MVYMFAMIFTCDVAMFSWSDSLHSLALVITLVGGR